MPSQKKFSDGISVFGAEIMTKIDRMIDGLRIINGKVISASFYNSSGDSIQFTCSPLNEEEQSKLRDLKWEVGNYGNTTIVGLTEYGPWS